MSDTTEQRLRQAAATGEFAEFAEGETLAAALIVELATVSATDKRVHAKGVRIYGATISGRLDFEDATLTRPLVLWKCTIPNGVCLDRADAIVVGLLDCPLIGAISGDGIRVHQSIFLRESTVKGGIQLRGAKIGGDCICDDAMFDGDGQNALTADGMVVEGGLFMRGSFSAKGSVRLPGAEISGDCEFSGASLHGSGGTALNGNRLVVRGGFFLRQGFSAQGMVDLSNAHVGVLLDDPAGWPRSGDLMLHGFIYDAIPASSPQKAAERLPWLARQSKTYFDPQPYEQLAKVLKAQGHATDARIILVEKERQRRKQGNLEWWEKVRGVLFDIIVGYGYRPWQALYSAAFIIALGWAVFDFADGYAHVMTPAKERVYMAREFQETRKLVADYPRLKPLIYSADLFLPFVDLRQDEYWMPSDKLGHRWIGLAVTIYMWLHIMLGWGISALFVAGVTGLIKRD